MLASSPGIGGRRCSFSSFHGCANSGRCSIRSRSYTTTFYLSLHPKSHSRPHQNHLVCEGHHLKERVTREFIRLSIEEVLFHTQAQSTSHETLASRHPDWFSTYYQILRSDKEPSAARDKAMEEIISTASEAWSRANASLFKHVLDYKRKLNAFLDKAGAGSRNRRNTYGP